METLHRCYPSIRLVELVYLGLIAGFYLDGIVKVASLQGSEAQSQ